MGTSDFDPEVEWYSPLKAKWAAYPVLDLQNVGRKIKKRRQTFGWSQRVLAEKTGLTPACVCQIEAGKRCPTIDSMYRISMILGYSIDALIKT